MIIHDNVNKVRVGNRNRDKEAGVNIQYLVFQKFLLWKVDIDICLGKIPHSLQMCVKGEGDFGNIFTPCEDAKTFNDDSPIQANSLCGLFAGPGQVFNPTVFWHFLRFSGARCVFNQMQPTTHWTICHTAGGKHNKHEMKFDLKLK